MKQILIITMLTFLFLNKTFACLNGESKILKDGTHLYVDTESAFPSGHIFHDDESYQDGIEQLDRLYKKTKDLDYLSDKGLLLILLKRYNEAVKLYLEIEKLEPNRYSTASNIGTTYELLGQNEKALFWIKKSVEIDAKSHNNSEWIHVNILEAKIKGESFYTTAFLLNTDFGLDKNPTTTLSKDELQKLSDALFYQLNERVSFVKPKEKIVAQLFFDLGNIAFLQHNYRKALANYNKAKEYGFTGQLIEERVKEAVGLFQNPNKVNNSGFVKPKNSIWTYAIWSIAATLAAFLTMIIFRRRKKNND